MGTFQYDFILQEYVNIVYNEGRIDDVIRICDYYHLELPNKQHALEWGFYFGEYVGKFRPGALVWAFELPNKTVIYFIGSKEDITKKIYDIV